MFISALFVFAVYLQVGTGFPTETVFALSTAHAGREEATASNEDALSEPAGGFSKIKIFDYSIDNKETSPFFAAAAKEVFMEALTENKYSSEVDVAVNSITAVGEDVVIEYSVTVNGRIWSRDGTDAVMYEHMGLFESIFGNSAVVIAPDDTPSKPFSKWVVGTSAAGAVVGILLIVLLSLLLKKQCSEPSLKYFYIRTQMSDKVMEVGEDEHKPVIMFDQRLHGLEERSGYQEIRAACAPSQMWYCDKQGGIKSKMTGYALELRGDKIIVASPDPSKKEQGWNFQDEYIVNKSMPDLVVDIRDEKDINGAEVCAWKNKGGVNQKWTREYV